MLKNVSFFAVVCLASLVPAAQAQDLFALPGSNSTNSSVAVLSPSTLANVATVAAGSGAFTVLATPDGSRFYIVANSGSQTVTEVPNSFANPVTLGNIGLGATAAAITPNGSRLVVAAGSLHVFDTSSNNDLLPNGLANVSGLVDVALSLDGTEAFALSATASSGSTLYAVNLSTLAVVATLPIQGQATGVAVGPNGYVYVSTVNEFLEINPATLITTANGIIALNATPTKAVFTPDGKYALLINQTPITGSSVIEIDLNAHVVANTIPNFNTVLTRLLVAGNNVIYAYSTQTQSLYLITVVPFGISPAQPAGFQFNNVTTAGLSSEVAGGTLTTAHYLYVASGVTLYRVDLTQNQLSGQQPLSATAGGVADNGTGQHHGIACDDPAVRQQSGPCRRRRFGPGRGARPGCQWIACERRHRELCVDHVGRNDRDSDSDYHTGWLRRDVGYGSGHEWFFCSDRYNRQRSYGQLHAYCRQRHHYNRNGGQHLDRRGPRANHSGIRNHHGRHLGVGLHRACERREREPRYGRAGHIHGCFGSRKHFWREHQ